MVLCFRFRRIAALVVDGSPTQLVVAPVMTNLDASGRKVGLLQDAEGQSGRHRPVFHLDHEPRRQPGGCVYR